MGVEEDRNKVRKVWEVRKVWKATNRFLVDRFEVAIFAVDHFRTIGGIRCLNAVLTLCALALP